MGKIFCEAGKTKQNMRDECNINNIMARYEKNGRLPSLIKQNPVYGDFSGSHDLLESYGIVEKAEMQFQELPAATRKRFGNSPIGFLKFVENPENEAELIKMGLANPKKTEVKEEVKKEEPQKKDEVK